MQRQRLLMGLLVATLLLLTVSVYAQLASRPWHDGSVWEIAFIRIKPGMSAAYLTYLTGDWKKEQEAMKAEGLILSYKVITTEGHTPGDWNMMLMTEYKDLATMEATRARPTPSSSAPSATTRSKCRATKTGWRSAR